MRSDLGPLLVKSSLEQFSGEMPKGFRELGELYIEHAGPLSELLDEGAQTLIHGDSHLGNVFLDGSRVGLLDWACVSRAPGMRDVSYFLCNSIDTELRRRDERALLGVYLDGLARRVATQITPWRSWIMAVTPGGAPSAGEYLTTSPRRMRTTPPPPPMPTHRLPSGDPTSACTGPLGRARSGSDGAQGAKRSPSKRTRPVGVPSQRYPSRSCAIANTSPGGRPFSVAQVAIA
jgi:hypothetical protein